MPTIQNKHKAQNKADKDAAHKLRWIESAEKRLLGRRIIGIRYLTDKETEAMGWMRSCAVLVLDDGTLLYSSADDEGNDGGALFGFDAECKDFALPVI